MPATEPTTYHFIVGTLDFLRSEPLEEVLEERRRHYAEQHRPIDFHWVPQPAFMEAPELKPLRNKLKEPLGAVVSTNENFIRWLAVRLGFVEKGSFVAPSESIPDPLRSLSLSES